MQVDRLVERAAADCGADPDCVCDWAGAYTRVYAFERAYVQFLCVLCYGRAGIGSDRDAVVISGSRGCSRAATDR